MVPISPHEFRRTLTWVRGLKHVVVSIVGEYIYRRTLTWVRGLKQIRLDKVADVIPSHPYMGAWIETMQYLPSRP